MAYACDICGKGKQFGHNVPFSQKKTNKVWKPNLQRQYIELDGSRLQIKVCTQCWRTLKKYRQADQLVDQPTVKAETDTEAKPKSAAKKPAAKKTATKS